MNLSSVVVLALIGVAAAFALVVTRKPQVTRAAGGKILAFLAFLILPVLAGWAGFNQHMQMAESTQFCLSCHVMRDYGHSLYVDDPSYLPAVHYQNRLVPRDAACYTCHTDYTLFGTVRSKFRGLRHIYIEYFGHIPQPQNIKLYTPFNNRECLHCHLGARPFEEEPTHNKKSGEMAQIKDNQLSCMSSGCHDTVHAINSLKDASFWKPKD